VGDDFRRIVAEWVDELQTRLLFGPNDPLFPRTKMGHDGDKLFCVAGVDPVHWADASPVRAIYKEAFGRNRPAVFPAALFPSHARVPHADDVPDAGANPRMEPEPRP